ncbi:non-structural maintenance of chromosomes element 3 homolog [Apostichopus japonicus]|uniref:non-structural maintenance of chromosomes element 3 homolog n=1 Tax=Stichopus japonicus TaxID=307972 RepID=UPI003AB50D55
MPRNSSNKKRLPEDDEDDDIAATSNPQILDRKIAELVQYLLMMEQNKVPVKRADISKNVLKGYKSMYQDVLSGAKANLSEVFGFEVIEVEHLSGKTKMKLYFLLNKMDSDLREGLVEIPAENPKNALLWIILAIIFMNEGMISEIQLWQAIQKLGLSQDEKSHPVYGDLKKLITTEFPRQLYLEYTRVANTDPAVYELRWGARAKAEVDLEKLLQMVTEIYGNNMTAQSWRSQYKLVQEWKAGKGLDAEEMVEDG